jgi:hypothetical protein
MLADQLWHRNDDCLIRATELPARSLKHGRAVIIRNDTPIRLESKGHTAGAVRPIKSNLKEIKRLKNNERALFITSLDNARWIITGKRLHERMRF